MSEVHVKPGRSDTVHRLIYRSHSRLPEGQESAELGAILRVARTNNARHGVTGALMLYDNWFAQVLEGPEAEVVRLFETIRADPRHDGIDLRLQETVSGRLFERWAMAYVGEHHMPDTPLTATRDGVAEAAPWNPTAEQDALLGILRDLTRGYGRGA